MTQNWAQNTERRQNKPLKIYKKTKDTQFLFLVKQPHVTYRSSKTLVDIRRERQNLHIRQTIHSHLRN